MDNKKVVLTGLDRELSEGCPNLKDRRIGLICNHTAVTAHGEHALDALLENCVHIVRLFGPEHGFRGEVPDGIKIESDRDSLTGLPCTSLYGQRLRPSLEELKQIDLLVYDIQDLGVRFYTYIWTLRECMAAAAESGTPFLVLDRPGIVGCAIEGNVLDEKFSSFVGQKPLAWRYAMTVGELATLYSRNGWLGHSQDIDLTVVKMGGYHRGLWADETGLPWIPPSPNIPFPKSCIHYPGTCLFEGFSSVTEGRGTENPFEIVGAPFVDGKAWADKMKAHNLQGIEFEPLKFTPRSIPKKVDKPKFMDQDCGGLHLVCTDREVYSPVRTAIALIKTLLELYPDQVVFREMHFDRLCGTDQLRLDLLAGKSLEEMCLRLESSLPSFLPMRQSVLIY